MAVQSKFRDVPRQREFVDPPIDIHCLACNKPHIHLFRNPACPCILCGPCWQKSAYAPNSPDENKCLRCEQRTDLRPYINYWKFIAVNVASATLFPVPHLIETIEMTPIVCGVDGCGHRAPLFDIIVHERACYQKKCDGFRKLKRALFTRSEEQPESETPSTPEQKRIHWKKKMIPTAPKKVRLIEK